MKFNQKYIVTACAAAVLAACGGGSSNNSNNNNSNGNGSGNTPSANLPAFTEAENSFIACNAEDNTVCVIKGDVNADYTLDAARTWYMDGVVQVGAGNVDIAENKKNPIGPVSPL